MGKIHEPTPVKLFAGFIYADELVLRNAMNSLTARFGPVDVESEAIRFTFTEYYKKEMGEGLWRKYISFAKLISPDELSTIKHFTNDLEMKLAIKSTEAASRSINIDPGYMELSKVILASTKNFSHRIYLGNGIYAEVTLLFRDRRFIELEWTYPDYRNDFVKTCLLKARTMLAGQSNQVHPESN